MAYASIIYLLGGLLLLTAGGMGLPLINAALAENWPLVQTFAAAAALTAFLGGGVEVALQNLGRDLSRKDGLTLMVLAYLIVPIFGGIPFLIETDASASEAYLEALSCITTTGFIFLPNAGELPEALHLWRATLGLLGGIGIVVFGVIVLGGLQLGGLEQRHLPIPHGHGGTMLRRTRGTAILVAGTFATASLAGAILLWLQGLSGTDALIYAMGALATSGISPGSSTLASVTPGMALVIGLLCVAGALNATLYIRKGRLGIKRFLTDAEARYFPMVAAGFAALLLLDHWARGDDVLGSVGNALFEAVSFLSTTGYQLDSEGRGVGLSVMSFSTILLALMAVIGGSTGSTASGFKLMRLSILLKHSIRELGRLAHPHGVVSMRYAGAPVIKGKIAAIISLFAIYLFAIAIVTGLLGLAGGNFQASVLGAVGALTNTGPLLADLQGAGFNDLGDLVLGIGMIAGRVEIIALIALLHPAYWRS